MKVISGLNTVIADILEFLFIPIIKLTDLIRVCARILRIEVPNLLFIKKQESHNASMSMTRVSFPKTQIINFLTNSF